MDKAYDPKAVEEKLYTQWEERGYFKPEIHPQGTPFSIVLPPPNVTGTLHIGHALMLVIEDILVRYHRMRGDKTLWLPGTDHAAIATQSKVEAILYKAEEKTRFDLGRDAFLQLVEEYAQKSHDTIVHQVRRMGASVDWSREAYTLDEARNIAVKTAFKRMYDDGLIYRGETIINWDPKLQTTVSDDEIEWKEEQAPLYYLKYGPFTIATARPETKFGDKYVVMHPDDKRYKKYKHGEKLEIDWINGTVTATVIKDSAIVMEFGTGVMTITPWHDKTDYEIAKRQGLDFEQIIDFNGKLLPIAKELSGIHIKKARPLIIEKIKQKGLLEKIDEAYVHKIATNYRGGGIIEPQIMKQWMVNVNAKFKIENSKLKGIENGEEVSLKQLMRHVVESGQIKITPSHFIKTYYHWIDNLRDWCISRQIWYGHQVPVWYRRQIKKQKFPLRPAVVETMAGEQGFEGRAKSKNDNEEMYVGINPPAGDGWEQDSDTLDTWFSSGLWTFSTLGWPQKTEDLATFHPTNVMETGYDILFFWVARMILMSTCLLGQVPFHRVLLHGLVRDAEKQKMSKSKGNVIDPLDLSEKYGTDALRIALIFSTAAGNDIPMSEDKVRGMKFFANKMWNMARFIALCHSELVSESPVKDKMPKQVRHDMLELKSIAENETDKEMVKKTQELVQQVTKDIDQFRLHEAAQLLYQFAWHEFADRYIEDVKTRMNEDSFLILHSLFLILLKLLHPFMPFITEEMYQKLGYKDLKTASLMIAPWPQNTA